MCNLYSLFHRAHELASRSIGMPSTIEEFFGQGVAVLLVDRPEAHPYKVVLVGILAQ